MEIERPNDLIRPLPRVALAFHPVERAQRPYRFFQHKHARHNDKDQHEDTHHAFRHVTPSSTPG
jgi:hypothetical protein